MKRSERLVDMVKYLLARPHTLIALPFFADRYGAAKSSISEDLAILRQTLANDQNGILENRRKSFETLIKDFKDDQKQETKINAPI